MGRSINHTVESPLKTNFTPVHQRGRRVPIDLQNQVEEELKKIQENCNIIKLDKCSEKKLYFPNSNYGQKRRNNKTSHGFKKNKQGNSQKEILKAKHRLSNGQHCSISLGIVTRR